MWLRDADQPRKTAFGEFAVVDTRANTGKKDTAKLFKVQVCTSRSYFSQL
jgi:hypothetical protein